MAFTNAASVTSADEFGRARGLHRGDTDNAQTLSSAVAWGAIVAGAAAAAALSMILLILGTGLGLASLSPWMHDGMKAATFGISTIVWVTVTQLLASGMGGYLAGRLRTRWLSVHPDEVYFRDTAHGFLAWAVASLATAALLTSTIGSIVGSGLQASRSDTGSAAVSAMAVPAGKTAASGSGMTNSDGDSSGSMAYFVDSLFRRDGNAVANASAPTGGTIGSGVVSTSTTASIGTATSAEITRIFMNALRTGTLLAEDVRHVGQVVAQRTGLPQVDAEKRVTDTYARIQAKLRDAETAAREAADKARKATVYATLWLFVALLMGAFVSSWAATCGGRQRDN